MDVRREEYIIVDWQKYMLLNILYFHSLRPRSQSNMNHRCINPIPPVPVAM